MEGRGTNCRNEKNAKNTYYLKDVIKMTFEKRKKKKKKRKKRKKVEEA